MTTLSLLQLVSPALPVGAFSYSEGLESLIQSGALKDEQEVEHWLNAELQQGALRFEAAALSHLAEDLLCWSTHADLDARNRIRDLNGWLLANRDASMVRAQQRQMGGSLLQLMAEMGHPLPQPLPLAWPAAWALRESDCISLALVCCCICPVPQPRTFVGLMTLIALMVTMRTVNRHQC